MGCGSSRGNTVDQNAPKPAVNDSPAVSPPPSPSKTPPAPETHKNSPASTPQPATITPPAATPPIACHDLESKDEIVALASNQDENDREDSSPISPYITPQTVDDFQAFVEFPTPQLLGDANEKYAQLKRPLSYAENGGILPYPTPSAKSSIFDIEKYESLDKFAITVDVVHYKKSLKEFTEFLTMKYQGDQLSIARVIFRWLAAQDIERYSGVRANEESVSWWLKRLENNPGYYADTYRDMCRYAGLQAEVIKGHAKHAHLEPGADPKAGDLNSWVAVVINKEWRIVDAHWGSSHMVDCNPGQWMLIDDNGQGYKDVNKVPERTTYAYNEVYFLTDPEQFIYSHIPSTSVEEKWQLLARPVTLREFTDMAYLKPAFFDLDLRLTEHRRCVLHASEGEIDIQIGTPPDRTTSFMYRLWMANQQILGNVKLERFCIMQQKNDMLYCKIYFPIAGKFKMELFGRDSGTDHTKDNSNYHRQVCVYVIHCDKPAEGVKAFPENVRREWGPGPDLQKSGLKPITHDDALIEAEDGTATVRFKMDKQVEVMHQLHSNTKTKDELKNQVVHYMDDDNEEVVLHIRLPEQGDYALNLFAKDAGTEGKLANVCSYVVSCETPASDPTPYPPVSNGRLGPMVGNKDVNLKLDSHGSPILTCSESGEITISFTSTTPCDTITGLELHTKDGGVKKENFVWAKHNGNEINYNIRFPESGVYTFDVFAKEEGTDGSFPHAYTCVINVPVPKEGCTPFPESFAQWTPQCEIFEPSTNTLPANSKIRFSVNIPHAHQVTTIGSNGWTSLEKDGNGKWCGEVETPSSGEELKLSAEVVEGSDSFTTLLLFKVEDAKDLKQEEEKQQQIQEAAQKMNEAKKRAEQEEKVRRQKEFEKVQKDLMQAIDSRDLTALRKAVKTVEKKKYVSRLSEHVADARRLIKSLERIQVLREAVLKMDQNTMLEIKNYASPPKLVHEVMIATLLLLGDREKRTREWPGCQKLLGIIGKDGLHRRVTSFDVTTLHPEIASRALQIVGRYRLDDVSDVSAGAGTFYAWVVGMIEELRVTERDAAKAPPANAKRQKHIFSAESKKKTGRG